MNGFDVLAAANGRASPSPDIKILPGQAVRVRPHPLAPSP
jgi:hypothetical protein